MLKNQNNFLRLPPIPPSNPNPSNSMLVGSGTIGKLIRSPLVGVVELNELPDPAVETKPRPKPPVHPKPLPANP